MIFERSLQLLIFLCKPCIISMIEQMLKRSDKETYNENAYLTRTMRPA